LHFAFIVCGDSGAGGCEDYAGTAPDDEQHVAEVISRERR
jgi:hypothetical protein